MELAMTVLRCPDHVAPEARTISGGEFHVGRGPDVDWVLPDPDRLLSKRHFAVAYRGGAWQVADTSTNGTFLNTDPEATGCAWALTKLKFASSTRRPRAPGLAAVLACRPAVRGAATGACRWAAKGACRWAVRVRATARSPIRSARICWRRLRRRVRLLAGSKIRLWEHRKPPRNCRTISTRWHR